MMGVIKGFLLMSGFDYVLSYLEIPTIPCIKYSSHRLGSFV